MIKINTLDLPETSLKHADIIKKKKFLKKIYIDWYNSFINFVEKKFNLEIGSGGGFLKEMYPSVITSDILKFYSQNNLIL